MAVLLSASCTGSNLLARNTFISLSGTDFSYKVSRSLGIVRWEGIGKLIHITDITGSRTNDIPDCSTVPPPPVKSLNIIKYIVYVVSGPSVTGKRSSSLFPCPQAKNKQPCNMTPGEAGAVQGHRATT
jgi:hypothetical protein